MDCSIPWRRVLDAPIFRHMCRNDRDSVPSLGQEDRTCEASDACSAIDGQSPTSVRMCEFQEGLRTQWRPRVFLQPYSDFRQPTNTQSPVCQIEDWALCIASTIPLGQRPPASADVIGRPGTTPTAKIECSADLLGNKSIARGKGIGPHGNKVKA